MNPLRVRRSISALLAGAALLLCQCGSTAPQLKRVLEVQEGDSYRAIYQRAGNSITYGVRKLPSGVGREDVYSGTAVDASLKVVDAESMQALLDLFAEQGFFDRAGPSLRAGAKESLTVTGADRAWIWSRLPAGQDDIPTIEAFQAASSYLFQLHNSTEAYYSGEGLTGDDLKRENEEVQQRSLEAIRNLKEGRKNL